MGESTETLSIKVDRQRLIADNQNINSKIELFTANEERVHDVSLHNIRLSLRRLGLPPQLIFPLGYVLKLVEKKDAFSLTLSDGLHNPNISSSFELFHEERIITWQVVRSGEKIKLGGLVVLAFPL